MAINDQAQARRFIREKIAKQRYEAINRRGIKWKVNEDRLVENVLASPYCQLTGQPLVFESNWIYTFSIDRKDSLGDYTDSNIQWTGVCPNVAKKDLPDDDFLDMCMAVVRHHGYDIHKKSIMAKLIDRRARRRGS